MPMESLEETLYSPNSLAFVARARGETASVVFPGAVDAGTMAVGGAVGTSAGLGGAGAVVVDAGGAAAVGMTAAVGATAVGDGVGDWPHAVITPARATAARNQVTGDMGILILRYRLSWAW